MTFQIFKNYDTLSQGATYAVLNLLCQKPNATICVASGFTPSLTYKKIVQQGRPEDFREVVFIGLDEWVGIPPHNKGSCRYFVERKLTAPLNIPAERVRFFDALAQDLEAECERMNDFIAARGGLDLMLVGVGLNGHIGLNEPGTPFDTYCHVSQLDPLTATVGQKYFKSETPLTQGITLGLRHFLEAKQAIILASGVQKADIIQKILATPPTEALPATIYKKHPNAYLWADRKAASYH
ncbi:MAG: glucosamine-6-phosphate deaminase [Runella sp.]